MAYIVCTSNLDLVSFLFVPALYSTLKLEIFPFIQYRACVIDLLGVGIIMCGIYCVYKQSRSCQLPFCASPIFHFEMEIFPFTCLLTFCSQQCDS